MIIISITSAARFHFFFGFWLYSKLISHTHTNHWNQLKLLVWCCCFLLDFLYLNWWQLKQIYHLVDAKGILSFSVHTCVHMCFVYRFMKHSFCSDILAEQASGPFTHTLSKFKHAKAQKAHVLLTITFSKVKRLLNYSGKLCDGYHMWTLANSISNCNSGTGQNKKKINMLKDLLKKHLCLTQVSRDKSTPWKTSHLASSLDFTSKHSG